MESNKIEYVTKQPNTQEITKNRTSAQRLTSKTEEWVHHLALVGLSSCLDWECTAGVSPCWSFRDALVNSVQKEKSRTKIRKTNKTKPSTTLKHQHSKGSNEVAKRLSNVSYTLRSQVCLTWSWKKKKTHFSTLLVSVGLLHNWILVNHYPLVLSPVALHNQVVLIDCVNDLIQYWCFLTKR